MPDPPGVTVSEEQHQRGIRLEDAAVFSGNLKDEVEVRLIARELVPVAEVGSDNGVATHGQPALAGDVVRQVGADEVDGLVRDFLHDLQAVTLDNAVDWCLIELGCWRWCCCRSACSKRDGLQCCRLERSQDAVCLGQVDRR
jgi:hypothetical protein